MTGKIISRWRLSNHKLKIETGRYTPPIIERRNRVCNLCGVLENEHHVIFNCPLYNCIRLKYTDLLSSENSVKKILNPSRDRIIETGKFLYEIEKEREKLKLQ